MPSECAGLRTNNTCTVLYKTLKIHLVASIIGCWFQELIGYLTFSGAPASNVDDSLDGAYLGPFITRWGATEGRHNANTILYVYLW